MPALKKPAGAARPSASNGEAALNQRPSIGVLIDDRLRRGRAALTATGRGWWVGRPVELPGLAPAAVRRPLRRFGTLILHWPREHVVKCLVHYHPDDDVENLRLEQEARLKELFCTTRRALTGHELLLEVIPPRGSAECDGRRRPTRTASSARRAERLYNDRHLAPNGGSWSP